MEARAKWVWAVSEGPVLHFVGPALQLSVSSMLPSWGLLDLGASIPGARMLTGLPLSAQEVLENLRDRWYQADNPPADLLLTEDEFLSFLHPEHSRGMLKFMVKEIIRDLGKAHAMAGLHPAQQASGLGVTSGLRVPVLPEWQGLPYSAAQRPGRWAGQAWPGFGVGW